jgi:hypothetical protein
MAMDDSKKKYMKWIGEFVAKRGAPTFWEVWQAACEVSNRTPAITQPESNDHKPSALPLGDAGKLVEALKDAERYRAMRDHGWFEYDEYVSAVGKPEGSTRVNREGFIKQYDENADCHVEEFSEALSTHLAGTSKGDGE